MAKQSRQDAARSAFQAALTARQQGRHGPAIHGMVDAVGKAPKERLYKVGLCETLVGAATRKFDAKLKAAVLACLQTDGLDHQELWTIWSSLLACDPKFTPLQQLIGGQEVGERALLPCLKDPFFLLGLRRLIIFDWQFEQAIRHLLTVPDLPGRVADALAAYARNTDYLVMDDVPADVAPYPVDDTIPTLSTPQSETGQAVRAQYEEHPYPRWLGCHVVTPTKAQAAQTHNHLIAGCGTGYATCQIALRYPHVSFTALDLSLASLSYAKSKANALGLTNIKFMQADILQLDGLEGTFDQIDCSGVLHHMADPVAGWRALKDKLAPAGRMHIGLYSALGRADVVAARALIGEQAFPATHQGIVAARHAIAALPSDHPARPVLGRQDFFSTASCRDLLFHVQEHRFTIPQIKAALDELGLKFGDFSQLDPELAKHAPADPLDLAAWQAVEEAHPRGFRAMYHFYCAAD